MILIHGEDTYRSRRFLESVVEQFKKKHDPAGNAVSAFDADEGSAEDFVSMVTGGGLFSSKRLVVARRALENTELRTALESLIEGDNIAADTSLVVYHAGSADKRTSLVKKLAAEPWSREFGPPDQAAVSSVIMEAVRELGGAIAPNAVSELAVIAGADSWRARNEAIKLAHASSGTITADDVRAHVRAPISEDIWSFVDAVAEGDRPRALAALEREF
ncbi:MAG: hypothetical protein HY462_01925, partial [Parcubacteria group bacterium]|nr:hypothetical protein [Parcubacteria group bacterium]